MPTTFPDMTPAGSAGLRAVHVYTIAALCLLCGLCVGYFVLGRHVARGAGPRTASPVATASATTLPGGHPKLTLDQMKQMADLQASSLIEKSKSDPQNAALLIQIAGIYQAAHQFRDASGYFDKALKIDPKNASARTELASCLYYSGDVDGALSQLTETLRYSPNNVNALFNLGMIKYRGKHDSQGAISAWQKLLKSNPNLDRRPTVEQLIAEARASMGTKN
ncbi:MAG TPA: tetratricopeptide repeat protein [Candidatus Eremiobacteraceae bacterium]|nr:tetratricopeptide repeat protein [Candidatus Eremiobacteraceae bacterium]